MEEFMLGTPAIVCRWRLANRRLPMENRHMRALNARRLKGEPLRPALVGWVKQHVEWTLGEGAQSHPDGVLMLVVDEQGRAAMTLGPYKPLVHTSVNDLLVRARDSWAEAQVTGVSPEDVWVARGDTLVWGTSSEFSPSAASSLVADLARSFGMPVYRDEDLLQTATYQGVGANEVFLVSDEHGVVPASDRPDARAQKFRVSYQKLLASMR